MEQHNWKPDVNIRFETLRQAQAYCRQHGAKAHHSAGSRSYRPSEQLREFYQKMPYQVVSYCGRFGKGYIIRHPGVEDALCVSAMQRHKISYYIIPTD